MYTETHIYSDSVVSIPLSAIRDGAVVFKISQFDPRRVVEGDVVNLGELPLPAITSLNDSTLQKIRLFLSSSNLGNTDLLNTLVTQNLTVLTMEKDIYWCTRTFHNNQPVFQVSREIIEQIPMLERRITLLQENLIAQKSKKPRVSSQQPQISARMLTRELALRANRKYGEYIPKALFPLLLTLWRKLSK